MRKDYFIKDEFNDVWNEEPLTTFKQAIEFRGYIQKDLNHPRILRITSTERGTNATTILKTDPNNLGRRPTKEIRGRAEAYSDSEF